MVAVLRNRISYFSVNTNASVDLMQYSLPYILITLFAVSFCSPSYAQTQISEVGTIRMYVHYVDSINNLGVQNNGFLHSVEDGVIKRNGVTVGGFGVYRLMNMKRDTVYRIEYNGGVDVTVNKVYYYKSNQIVFARLELLDKKGVFYHREEFYNDGNNLFTDLKNSKRASSYSNETALSLFEDSLRFLENFKKTNNRH